MKTFKGLLGLLGLSALSFWALQLVPQEPSQLGHRLTKQKIDYFSVDYTKLQMNALGLPDNQLYAENVEHDQETDETRLHRPILTQYQEQGQNWVSNSESGVITEQGAMVFLQGLVTIDRAASSTHRAVNIVTRDLQVQPNKQYAETDKWAELVTGQNKMSGVGVQLFYKEPMLIQLLAKVRGRHEVK